LNKVSGSFALGSRIHSSPAQINLLSEIRIETFYFIPALKRRKRRRQLWLDGAAEPGVARPEPAELLGKSRNRFNI